MANLKELIKEAKNNPKLWNTKVKLKSSLIIKKPLQELNSDHYWNKVEIIDSWYPDLIESFNSRGFFYYLDAGNGGDVIRIGNSGKEKFKYWFELYTGKNPYEFYGDCDLNENFWGFARLPRDKAKLELANLFKNASKVFSRDGNDKAFLNQDAFEFMQIATGHEPLSISYQAGEEFFLKDFENDVDKIGDEIAVEVISRQTIEKVKNNDKKERDKGKNDLEEKNQIEIAPIIPTQWQGMLKEKSRFNEKYDEIKEVIYESIYEERPLDWITNNEPLPLNKLPIRLYNVEKEEEDARKCVENVVEDTEVENYAILSYVWGGDYNAESGELSPGGKKSLKKAIEACNYLGIKYLWIDQLCINQNDWKEKAQEVPKMRQYYSNATVTLVSIQKNILDDDGKFLSREEALKSIINSEWFSRSWTFQEGWLSKQTIFMFDDALVDGRDLAQFWALNQGYSNYGKYNNQNELNKASKKIATPLGWVYCEKGYNSEDRMSLSLNQALLEIKQRKRSLIIDGIYSILGLLPYGDNQEIKVDYSLSPQEALRNVMKIALKNGYGEPLSWFGIGNDWIPEIDNSGSTSVAGAISVTYIPKSLELIKPNGLEINGLKCSIENILSSTSKELGGNYVMEGGIYKRDVLVKLVNSQGKHVSEKLKLLGTEETLEKIRKGNILLILNKEEWESSTSFAILVSRKSSRYQRVGLVEFQQEINSEISVVAKKEKIVISSATRQIEQGLSNLQIQEELQSHQEVSPKK